MSPYPQTQLDELARILAEDFADPSPEAGTAGKNFLVAYNCRPILFGDRTLWVSEDCLTDEDNGLDTAANTAEALKELDLAEHLKDRLDRELLVTHRTDSTPSIPPAKLLSSWGSWNLLVPKPSLHTGT